MNIREYIKYLENNYDCDTEIVNAIWLGDDIRQYAEELGIEITKEQVTHVIEWLDHNWDADLGINWNTIELAINEIVKK